MRRLRATLLLMLLALLTTAAAGGCSLIVDFDPEGKPCNNKYECLEGYTCVHRADAGFVCISSENAGAVDGGLPGDLPDGAPDAG